jgi:hypothetical protein
MPGFNGKGANYCQNCGGEKGLHRYDDNACPVNGEDQTGRKHPAYHSWQTFEPQEPELEIKARKEVDAEVFDRYFSAVLPALIEITPYDKQDCEIKTLVDVAVKIADAAVRARQAYLEG